MGANSISDIICSSRVWTASSGLTGTNRVTFVQVRRDTTSRTFRTRWSIWPTMQCRSVATTMANTSLPTSYPIASSRDTWIRTTLTSTIVFRSRYWTEWGRLLLIWWGPVFSIWILRGKAIIFNSMAWISTSAASSSPIWSSAMPTLVLRWTVRSLKELYLEQSNMLLDWGSIRFYHRLITIPLRLAINSATKLYRSSSMN